MPTEIERKFLVTNESLADIDLWQLSPHVRQIDALGQIAGRALTPRDYKISQITQLYVDVRKDSSGFVIHEDRIRSEQVVDVSNRLAGPPTVTHVSKIGGGLQRIENHNVLVDARLDFDGHLTNQLRALHTPAVSSDLGWAAKIVKYRTTVKLGAHLLELDRYISSHYGLCVAEIEFPNIAKAAAFNPTVEPWSSILGYELTGMPEFVNADLAIKGRVPDLSRFVDFNRSANATNN